MDINRQIVIHKNGVTITVTITTYVPTNRKINVYSCISPIFHVVDLIVAIFVFFYATCGHKRLNVRWAYNRGAL